MTTGVHVDTNEALVRLDFTTYGPGTIRRSDSPPGMAQWTGTSFSSAEIAGAMAAARSQRNSTLSLGASIETLQGLRDLVALFSDDPQVVMRVPELGSAGFLGPLRVRRELADKIPIESMSYSSPWEIRLRFERIPERFVHFARNWNEAKRRFGRRASEISSETGEVGSPQEVYSRHVVESRIIEIEHSLDLPSLEPNSDYSSLRELILVNATDTLTHIDEIVLEHGWFA